MADTAQKTLSRTARPCPWFPTDAWNGSAIPAVFPPTSGTRDTPRTVSAPRQPARCSIRHAVGADLSRRSSIVPNLPSYRRHRGGIDRAIDRDVDVRSSSPAGHHGGLEEDAHRCMNPDPAAIDRTLSATSRLDRSDRRSGAFADVKSGRRSRRDRSCDTPEVGRWKRGDQDRPSRSDVGACCDRAHSC